MSFDLMLKPSCSGCGSTSELYGSNCKHMTLCLTCGKTMAEKLGRCYDCGALVTCLIREYNVRASPCSDKQYFIGRFVTGLPSFSMKKNAENKWALQKGLQEKYKNKPWLLEDETGQQYQGHLEGSQSAAYYILTLQGKEFVAIPAGSWYKFNKVAQYKQLTLEEAEEKMRNRRKAADGYERWMMKAANNGAAAFGEVEHRESGTASGRGHRTTGGNEEEGNVSDRGDEDEEEAVRKNRLGLNKRCGFDDEEGPRGGDHDIDDDDPEMGDDWEHEEIFTDDDEAVGNGPEEREDLAPDVPAPPEIKQDEDEENDEGGLSKSGKELKKLLGRASGLNDSDADDDGDGDDDDEDMDEDDLSPVLAPKKGARKDEPDNSPAKLLPSGSAKGTTSTSKSAKGKRKLNGDDAKSSSGGSQKKVKAENELKPTVKEESTRAAKSSATPKVLPPSSLKTGPAPPVTEDEIRAVLLQNGPVTTKDLVARFKSRLEGPEDKKAFTEIMRRISMTKKIGGSSYVVVKK